MTIDIAQILTYFLAMLFSLTIHEAAHAWVAYLRGDSTARDAGRLTLDPFAHAEPFGTFILPLLGAILHLPIIGWAKPVPVNLKQLKNPKWDNVLVSAAGPAANLFLCVVCIVAQALAQRLGLEPAPGSFFAPLLELATAMVWVNAFLAVFNLIPLPPLDGAAVLGALLPLRWSLSFEKFVRPYGYMMLMMLIISGGLHWVPKFATYYVEIVEAVVGHMF